MFNRLRLASQSKSEGPARPKLSRFLGEGSYAFSPLTRHIGRANSVEQAANPSAVLILPGFLARPLLTRYLAKEIARAGHSAHQWELGFNFGPSEPMLEQLDRQIRTVADRESKEVTLLGWSLGGIYARELAKRQPDLVGKVITMGSPFSGDRRANNAWRLYQLVTGHSVDAPPIEVDIAAKPPVETVAMWSPRDGIVSPRSARGKSSERDRAIALRCTHMGFSYSPEAIHVVLRELDRS